MKYVSKCHNLTLCVKPNRNQIIDGIVVAIPGEHVRFSRNEFETKDKKTIEFLDKHNLNGSAFTKVNESDVKEKTTAEETA